MQPVFSWDGRNNWKSRYDAGIELHNYWQKLKAEGWICHFMRAQPRRERRHQACSKRSGNTCIHFIATPRTTSGISPPKDCRPHDHWYQPWTRYGLGEIVCLGTPFLDMPQFDWIWIGPDWREDRVRMLRTAALWRFHDRPLAFTSDPEVSLRPDDAVVDHRVLPCRYPSVPPEGVHVRGGRGYCEAPAI